MKMTTPVSTPAITRAVRIEKRPDNVRFNSIVVSQVLRGGGLVDVGERYIEVSENTSGFVADICTEISMPRFKKPYLCSRDDRILFIAKTISSMPYRLLSTVLKSQKTSQMDGPMTAAPASSFTESNP